MNPLLDFSGLPRFSEFKPALVSEAIDTLIGENRALLERLVADATPASWEDFVSPLEDANERLSRAWGQVSHLNSVINSSELRDAYNANLPKVTQYWAELSQNESLYRKYRLLSESAEYAGLDAARKRVVAHELRDFRLGGAELESEAKLRFLAIQEELAALSAKFEENLLDATNAYEYLVVDQAMLAGLPADVVATARDEAAKAGKEGWKLTLRAPSYLPVMQFSEVRDLRKTLYRAYVTRASEFGSAELDNTDIIRRIVRLRQEAAAMLGYPNYGELSLVPKMADSTAEVFGFLEELAAKAKPFAERDFSELKAFAEEELGLEQVEAWDIAWVSEKLRTSRYAYSEQEVKQYFQEPLVLEGLFGLLKHLYGLTIRREEASVWHEDVGFFTLYTEKGSKLGHFYLDAHARSGKRGGAWMDDVMGRRRLGDGIQLPVAYVNCNFGRGVDGKPALLTHDEIITLFHEFGHALHHLMTQVEELGVSGINGVEWDAVELPSQFMENFCWEWRVVSEMSRHAATGETMPRALFEKMEAAKNFQSGMQFVRQIEFALFDLHLHTDFDPDGDITPLQLLDQVRRQVAVVVPPAYNRFPNSFGHIFSGGYAAGYYSYKWAEVLSADAFSLFEETDILDQGAARRFWDEILAVGGARPALESFISFRGRAPGVDALLRHSGLTPS